MFNNNSMNYYSTSTLKSALLKSYAWMAIALSITAIVSYGLYATNALLILLSTMPFLFMLFVIAPFILSIAFGVSMARSTSSTGMKVMLVLYAICMGVSLTSIGYVYDVATIGTAFLVSAVYFISLAVIGTTSKKDFTSFVLTLLMELIGEKTLSMILLQDNLFQPIIAALFGFIPNCAATVVLTQLYTAGELSFGSLLAGLVTNAGLGLIVMIRYEARKKDILRTISILFITGVIVGIGFMLL